MITGLVVTGLVVARRRHLSLANLLDSVAPALPLAQSIGRWGNWFNQELFGRPSTLPWAVRIDPANRPAGLEQFTSFHPTFLYESLWNLAVVGVVILVEQWVRRDRPQTAPFRARLAGEIRAARRRQRVTEAGLLASAIG